MSGHVIEESPGHLRRAYRIALSDRSNRGDDVHGRRLLEDVTARTTANRPQEVLSTVLHRYQQTANRPGDLLRANDLPPVKAHEMERIENDHAVHLASFISSTFGRRKS